MADDSKPIPEEDYQIIERSVPIVSVDLLVHHKGGLVLGKRTNEPAVGEWLIPGGTVLKGETLREAANRVANEELDCRVVIDQRLGTYEHFYETSPFDDVEGKQYLATAFVVTPATETLQTDDQHSELRIFKEPFPDLHNYVERYIRDLRAQGFRY